MLCAIAGIIGLDLDEKTIEKMLKTMNRRGPDENGVYKQRRLTLLHSRLAIVDLEKGKQPMHLSWAGEEYTLVYNGELYNSSELRMELMRCGHDFIGYSDTEIVLHSYAQWGADCLNKMNGIFSFGIWETKRNRLFLARDRIGVKPLFYTVHNGGLIFASEIKTILQYPSMKARLNTQGAMELIMLGPGRLPGSGIFQDIYEIEPGSYAYYENSKFNSLCYWKLVDREHTDSFEETAEKVRYLVIDSIKRQLVSDVTVGTFLSGGLDSSIITAVCAEEKRSSGIKLDTFSVDYADNEKYFRSNKFQPNSDTAFIEIMTTEYLTQHHKSVLTAEELASALKDAMIARDLPGMADVDASLLIFCKEIRNHVKVALSGECADEIFGGYPWYRDRDIRAQEGFPWAQNTNQRAAILSNNVTTNNKASEFVMDAYRKTCNESDILPDNNTERRMKEMVNLNFRWFMQTLLDRKDRMSMYHSLEVRVPFCDYRIAEYLYSVPWEYKDWQGREKGLLRKAMEGILPEEVLYRKKSPYPKILDPQYERIMEEEIQKLIQEKNAPLWHMTDRNSVINMIQGEQTWPWYGQLMRRPQTMAFLLQLNFWLEYYNVEMIF